MMMQRQQWLPPRRGVGPSLDLPAEGAALGEAGEATSGLAEHHVAIPAKHHRLGVAVDSGDLQAAWALDIHEEAVRRLDHALQLVLRLLILGIGVQQVAIHCFLKLNPLSRYRA